MQLGQLKFFETPSFQLDAEAFKYDDSRNVPEALSIRATAFMVTFGNLQPSQTDKLIQTLRHLWYQIHLTQATSEFSGSTNLKRCEMFCDRACVMASRNHVTSGFLIVISDALYCARLQ